MNGFGEEFVNCDYTCCLIIYSASDSTARVHAYDDVSR